MKVFTFLRPNSTLMKQTLCIAVLALSWASIGQSQTASPKSFWINSTIPSTIQDPDTTSVTLGLQFSSDVPGSVTAVRFYKGTNNTGTHVGNLWSSTGAKLAEVTFSGETASGWQQANFSAPISIAANTKYVISYLAPKGRYAVNQYYSWSTLSAAPLRVSGSSPGVYTYASQTSFPKSVWNASSYWVDLVFVPAGSSTTTYSISGKVSGSAAKVTLSGATSGSTNTDASGNYSFSGLPNGSFVVTPSQSGFTFSPVSTSVAISGASKAGVNFTATPTPATTYSISGKVSGSVAKVTLSGVTSGSTNTDASGNYSFSSLPNGSYVVTPSQPGYTFSPSTTSVSISGASKAGVNFAAIAVQPPVSHSITLTWNSSTSPSISGYNVYRGSVSKGPYTKLNASPIATTSYLDSNVAAGQTYFYVATTVQSTNESTYSPETTAVVPIP